ncbi:Tat binding protein 1-interacting protein-domain-containing protein [Naematelia encephala]|uniref:Tat binding protein 1-interacting protein-domain-containing protein n=1 Tax=Naematelia encephala TaxID=71784 RepID=A0A1Y2BHR4_9TREE|nr:Tat binding protein 1-interacting protein-domain-containing protein [Naematelia encephala]
MPPKTAVKEKVVKGDEAEDMVLQYLRSVNRPYASTDVSANLKNKVPKAAAQKILASLADKGALTVKTYGKQTIFVYNQSTLPVLPANEMAALDKDLKVHQGQLDDQRKQLRSAQSELSTQEAQPRTSEISKEIERVKAENEMTLRAILPFRGSADSKSNATPMSAEDTRRIDEEFIKWRKEWVSRRKMYKELLGMLQDGGQITDVNSFQDDQGIIVDDHEAKEVEEGEFCKTNMPPQRGATSRKATPNETVSKRPSSSSQDDNQSKKKKTKRG